MPVVPILASLGERLGAAPAAGLPGPPSGVAGAGSVVGVDPGPQHSALCLYWPGERRVESYFLPNATLLLWAWAECNEPVLMGIEMIQGQGMAVGQETFETCVFIGELKRTWELHGFPVKLLQRSSVRTSLLGSARGTDAQIRQAVIDRFGGDTRAIGGKKCVGCKGKKVVGRLKEPCSTCDGSGWLYKPGPLFGIASHGWQALAAALVAAEAVR